MAVEALLLLILGANHVRFAPPGWARSPLLPGAGLVGVMLVATTAPDLCRQALVAAGAIALGVTGVRALHPLTRRAPLLTAVLATLLGGAAARAVLLTSALPDQPRLAHPVEELSAELRPFRRSGTGNEGPRIAFITIDTLRADRMVKMGSWKRLAERGRSWDRAMSTSSWTLPAMASLATGLPVEGHGASARSGGNFQGIKPGVPTLAVELARSGYTCAAVFTNSWMTPEMGFADGFHRFVHADRSRPHWLALAGAPAQRTLSAAAVVDRAIREADALPPRGGFLWIHLMDPHLPYAHAEGPVFEHHAEGAFREGMLLDEDARAEIRRAYDAEVAQMDVELLRLLDHLEATGWMSDFIAMTSDHGEEFWEHGAVEHGHSHHGEVLDVGLVFVAPGGSPAAAPGVASLLDLTSTARAVAGLPPRGLDLRVDVPADRVATAWGNVFYRNDASARQGSRRVIARGDGAVLVYDLAADPAERVALDVEPDDALVQATLALVPPEVADEADINRSALEALGYVSP